MNQYQRLFNLKFVLNSYFISRRPQATKALNLGVAEPKYELGDRLKLAGA